MKYYLNLILGCIVLSSCSDNNPIIDEPNISEKEQEEIPEIPKENPYRFIELDESEKTIATSQLSFAIDFFKTSSARLENKNFIISPLSAYIDLSIIANGAAGNTQAEIVSRLLDNDNNIDKLNNYNKRILAELPTLDNTALLELANSIWHSQSITLESNFSAISKDYYESSINSGNFADSKTAEQINSWISDATHGLIKNFDIPNSNYQLLIANALYFNAKWTVQFDPKKTKDADFNNYDGSISKVKMMEGKFYKYIYPSEADGKFAIVSLPYGNNAFSFCVAFSIDEKDYSLNGVDKILTHENLQKIIKDSYSGDKFVKLPQFEISTDGDLISDLKALGITELFSNKANLSNLTKQSLGENFITQKSTLTINEIGTEAGVYTENHIVLSDINSKPVEHPSFTIDRPFVFWIMEKSINSVLFMGQIDKL